MEITKSYPPQGKNSALPALPQSLLATKWRVVLLLALIFSQIFALKFAIRPQSASNSFWIPGGRFSALVYYALGLILLLSVRGGRVWRELISSAQNSLWKKIIFPQVACCFLILYFSSKLYPTYLFSFDENASDYWVFWFAMLTGAIVVTSLLSLMLVAPGSYWQHFFSTEKSALLLALIFPVINIIVYCLAVQSDDVLSRPTITLAKFFLDLFYTDIRVDLGNKTLGASNFDIVVDQMCSGYAGIGMITVFLTWYLITFKSRFRFPAILLLIPIGGILIWLSNCLRVALIVAMGSSVSSKIAMEGLHTNAGWIFFITISSGLVLISNHARLFCKKVTGAHFVVDSTSALAIPFLLMLAVTLILSSLSAGFQWLYPVRAVATGVAVLLLWRHIKSHTCAPGVFPVIAGTVVFLLWIALVPSSDEIDSKFAASLFGVPAVVSVAWIVFRLLGSVIIIPIAEELAFRGYLPALFHGNGAGQQFLWEVHMLPLLASSLLFGALHSALLAGTLAGAVYYVVKLRSGKLWDAVLAHMSTNLLLSTYVLLSGHWSYW